jgi:hypothetical protein
MTKVLTTKFFKVAKLSISYRKESKSGQRSYAKGDRFKTKLLIGAIANPSLF